MGAAAVAGIGALGSYYAAKQSRKASEKTAQQMMGLDKAGLEARRVALPQLQSLIMNWFGPRLGKESPFLRGEYERSLTGIGRQERVARAGSQQRWAATGNIGRGRGEQFRIGRMAEEARGGAGLSFGRAQEDYQTGVATDFMNALNMLAQTGAAGLTPAMMGLQTGLQGQQDYWASMGGIAGELTGFQQQKELTAVLQDILDKMK